MSHIHDRVRYKGTHIAGTITEIPPDSLYVRVRWDGIGYDDCLPEMLEKVEGRRGKRDRHQLAQAALQRQMYPYGDEP